VTIDQRSFPTFSLEEQGQKEKASNPEKLAVLSLFKKLFPKHILVHVTVRKYLFLSQL
jgi:hypothetical protein